MGFALWREGPLVYCEGTHEYRAMGTAVVHENGVLSARDFQRAGARRTRGSVGFVGYFASLGEVNAYLRKQITRRSSHRILATM
jgi:hypothetical protein